MLSTAYDRTLGGRNFDRALADHFAKVFQVKYKIDVKSNMKAWIRLEVRTRTRNSIAGHTMVVSSHLFSSLPSSRWLAGLAGERRLLAKR